jgi:FkbM family methyltransferase
VVLNGGDRQKAAKVCQLRGTSDWGVVGGLRSDTFIPRISNLILDCGAHVGFFALYALQQGASKVICVEPPPVSFKRLEVNLATYVADGRVILHNGAVVTPADHSKPLFITDRGYHSKVGTEGGTDKFEVPTKFLLTGLLNPTTASGDVPTCVKVDSVHRRHSKR